LEGYAVNGKYTIEFWFDEGDFYGYNTGWKALVTYDDITDFFEASTKKGVLSMALGSCGLID
jgi:hypothetical protein